MCADKNKNMAMVIYSTTVIGQDRRIAYNERNLTSAFPHAKLVYLDMLERGDRQRVRATLVGGTEDQNIRFPQLFSDGRFVHFGEGLYGR
jgi:hypothetical protein